MKNSQLPEWKGMTKGVSAVTKRVTNIKVIFFVWRACLPFLQAFICRFSPVAELGFEKVTFF